MWLADNWKYYEVLDTSAGEKLERWGKYILVRPDPQVIWNTPKDDPLWRKYDARYARSNTGGGKWQNLPAGGLRKRLKEWYTIPLNYAGGSAARGIPPEKIGGRL